MQLELPVLGERQADDRRWRTLLASNSKFRGGKLIKASLRLRHHGMRNNDGTYGPK